jgi:hypothetical protein
MHGPSHIFGPAEHLSRPQLDQLVACCGAPGPLMFHLFSNNGIMLFARLQRRLQQQAVGGDQSCQGALQRVRAVVYDSTPDPSYDPKLLKQVVIASIASIIKNEQPAGMALTDLGLRTRLRQQARRRSPPPPHHPFKRNTQTRNMQATKFSTDCLRSVFWHACRYTPRWKGPAIQCSTPLGTTTFCARLGHCLTRAASSSMVPSALAARERAPDHARSTGSPQMCVFFFVQRGTLAGKYQVCIVAR